MKTIYALLLSLFLTFSLNAQLSKTRWQWQNPNPKTVSQIVWFDNGKFNMSTMDLATKEQMNVSGTYSYDGETLILYSGEYYWSYDVERNNNVMFLYDNANDKTLKFAIFGSNDDTFMKRLLNSATEPTYTPSYTPSYTPTYTPAPERPKTCYTCYGLKTCQICKGSGWCSGMYGQPGNKCKACDNSSGKCWHCKGSGIQ